MHTIIHVAAAVEGGGRAAAPGYYLVLVSRRGRRHRFGPFATQAQARLLQRSAVTLGLVAPERRQEHAPPPVERRGVAWAA